MLEIIGFNAKTSAGCLLSGASTATLVAVATAREAKGLRARDYERSVVYLARNSHSCVRKALKLAGLAEAPMSFVEVDDNWRMDVRDAERKISEDKRKGLTPFLLVGTAGSAEAGCVDPLDELAEIAEREGMWYHVDAAYGGFFMLCPDLRGKFSGIVRADSVAIDPHKGLFLPYGTGAILVRDGRRLYEANSVREVLLQDHVEKDGRSFQDLLSPCDLSPELTRHFRGLRMWMPLQLFGIAPFRDALKEKVLLCRHSYEEVRKVSRFEVGPSPELSVYVFRYVPRDASRAKEANERLLAEILEDGRILLSSTTIGGTYWIRMAVLSFRTHLDTIRMAHRVISEAADRLPSNLA